MILSEAQREELAARYRGRPSPPDLAYGTVEDYCDSCDYLPALSHHQADLKDLQRPWMVKCILSVCQPGSSLLEIGPGEPLVAQVLAELGYEVTAVDPYDGSANGPVDFDRFKIEYPDVNLVRGFFAQALDVVPARFDAIYSISVLEHFSKGTLFEVFHAIRCRLVRGGYSLHVVDHAVDGWGADFHLRQLAMTLKRQQDLAASTDGDALKVSKEVTARIRSDIDTYYLSAAGHNLWRGRSTYDEYRFRRVGAVFSSVSLGSTAAVDGVKPG